MLMSKKSVFIAIIMSCLFCQCGERDEDDAMGKDYPSKETFAAIDNSMSFMTSNPEKAHHMLDSLTNAKLMTRERCDYFHAMVIFSGESNPDSALMICNRLLTDGKFGDDKFLEEEICVLASNITSSSRRHVETLKYANRGIAICHGDEQMRGDEAALMSQVGAAEQGIGRTEQAKATYARALDLLKPNESFADFIALISLKRRQGSLYNDSKEYDKVLGICREVLGMVNHFDRDPSIVAQRPGTMKESSKATHDFAEFYRSQVYGKMASIFRKKIEDGLSSNPQADTDSVKAYIEKWSKTEGAQSPDKMAAVMHELYFAGKKAEFHAAKPKVEEFFRGDSLVSEYVDYLTLIADDAAASNDLPTSNRYLRRALTVSDSIRRQEMMRELSQQMSIYMVQEQQLARQDAENELARQRTLIILETAMLAILLIAGLLILWLYRKNKHSEQIIETTQHDLTETKQEIKVLEHKLEETKQERTVNNTQHLYDRIERAMDTQKLYLNPDLSIETFAEAVNSSRSVVSACINSISGKPFRQWLSEYRLALFKEMIDADPNESIDILMMRCGYREQSTFRRQFKAAYGMSPGKYRKQLLGDGDENINESENENDNDNDK